MGAPGEEVYSAIDAQHHDLGDLDAGSDGYSFGPFALGDRGGVYDAIAGEDDDVEIDETSGGDRFAWRGEASATREGARKRLCGLIFLPERSLHIQVAVAQLTKCVATVT
ncbi:hypothetical protein WMF28_17090 [Sorangium sp. So ce590]|uniref:hypothetical protein n=1 Tax=Sorangium sp. So ce590 TaxID=3133317 RepID=UPI003F61217F